MIEKKDTKFRKTFLPDQQLVITLCFLASGESWQSLSYSYRVGKAAFKIILCKCHL